MEDDSVLKIGQNLKYDLIMLRRAGEEVGGIDIFPYDDTMLLSYDLDAGHRRPRHGRSRQAPPRACLHRIQTVCGTGKNLITFDKVALPQATEYAAEDADVTFRLWKKLKPRLAREGSTRVYEMVDRPLVPVLARMEMAGILVDRAELSRLSADLCGRDRAGSRARSSR